MIFLMHCATMMVTTSKKQWSCSTSKIKDYNCNCTTMSVLKIATNFMFFVWTPIWCQGCEYWHQLGWLPFLMYFSKFSDMWYVWHTIEKLSLILIDWRDCQWISSQLNSSQILMYVESVSMDLYSVSPYAL